MQRDSIAHAHGLGLAGAILSCGVFVAALLHAVPASADPPPLPDPSTSPVTADAPPLPDPSASSVTAAAPPTRRYQLRLRAHQSVPAADSTSAASPGPSREESATDKPGADAHETSIVDRKLLSGFRIGYLYVEKFDKPVPGLSGESLAQRTGMRSPHQFLVGYEAFYRMVSHSWLNVLLVGNVMVSGLEQSKFYPSANALIGFEFHNAFQVGVGINLTPLRDSAAHTVFAAGWTPRVGNFYVPIHVFFVPDVDGNHKMGITTGVTW